MEERFRLNRTQFERMFDETVQGVLCGVEEADRDDVVVDLDVFLIDKFVDPKFHDASLSECLAWLLYLAGISGCVEVPEGFGGKSVLAHCVRGPIADDALLIQVAAMDIANEPVCAGPFDADQLLGGEADSTPGWRRKIADVVEAMLREADPLIPQARAAAERQ